MWIDGDNFDGRIVELDNLLELLHSQIGQSGVQQNQGRLAGVEQLQCARAAHGFSYRPARRLQSRNYIAAQFMVRTHNQQAYDFR